MELADQHLAAVLTSATLAEAQDHAQAVINTLVGAWGRWYDVGRVDDPSDRRGVFPGERVPGPANDTPGDWSPVGWGLRAYAAGGSQSLATMQAILGNPQLWMTNPRGGYDTVARGVAATHPGQPLAGRLDGHATRALAWARLIVAQADTLAAAQPMGAAGQQEIRAALASAATLSP